MPAAYAHMTLVNELSEPRVLESISGFSDKLIPAVLDYFKFCELGSVSPDLPYLALGDSDAAIWADKMHYENTCSMIAVGARNIQDLSGTDRDKAVAWLLGYAAHVAMDVTIHPVVELKVGPYHGNETDHRLCEMNQDAYIFPRLNLGDIGLSEHLDSGIGKCTNVSGDFDPVILRLWDAIFQEVHQGEYHDNTPDINKWFKGFVRVVDNIAEEGNRLLPLARHVAAGAALVYPLEDEVDETFIRGLRTPRGSMGYDAVFDLAKSNVGNLWASISEAILQADNAQLVSLGEWNLDTGRDQNDSLVYWS